MGGLDGYLRVVIGIEHLTVLKRYMVRKELLSSKVVKAESSETGKYIAIVGNYRFSCCRRLCNWSHCQLQPTDIADIAFCSKCLEQYLGEG